MATFKTMIGRGGFVEGRKRGWHQAMVCLLLGMFAMPVMAAGVPQPSARSAEPPVMGWSSWSFLRMEPTSQKVVAQAQALVASGLANAGYRYVNLDDFWYICPKEKDADGREVGPAVDEYGRWMVDEKTFPGSGNANGMATLGKTLHSMGLKFGVYITPGISRQAVARNTVIQGTHHHARDIAVPGTEELNYNCGGMVSIDFQKAGAQQYIDSLVNEFAAWGADFIKLDGMTNANAADVKAWSMAIRQSGRAMVLDITQGNFTSALAPALSRYAQQWVPTPDIECYVCDEASGNSFPLTSWENIKQRFDYVTVWGEHVSPGHYNDYDSIEIGNGNDTGLSFAERRTQMSLWALASAPLIMGTDLTHLDQKDLGLLTNPRVIRIDQDGIAARRILDPDDKHPDRNHLIFAKVAPNGDVIVGLFNASARPGSVTIDRKVLGVLGGLSGWTLENVWDGTNRPLAETIGGEVPAHDVLLYRVARRQ